MISVTEQKKFEEVLELLGQFNKVYIIGCGTCTTQLHTGGRTEVLEMKKKLEEAGREVTGWMVIPTACDELTNEALKDSSKEINQAEAILIMSCAYGAQTVSAGIMKPVIPAVNTLFIGKETGPDSMVEWCLQCGDCVIGITAGLCPVTRCAKSLLNGPCGGSVNGKCEVSPEIPCVWQEIYDRLNTLGMLDRIDKIQPAKNWKTSHSGGPRRLTVKERTDTKAVRPQA
ncbi:MAG: methylenetetrahydrofolate reductase C-terminal domain-containing protein [Chloroflexota bacterium]